MTSRTFWATSFPCEPVHFTIKQCVVKPHTEACYHNGLLFGLRTISGMHSLILSARNVLNKLWVHGLVEYQILLTDSWPWEMTIFVHFREPKLITCAYQRHCKLCTLLSLLVLCKDTEYWGGITQIKAQAHAQSEYKHTNAHVLVCIMVHTSVWQLDHELKEWALSMYLDDLREVQCRAIYVKNYTVILCGATAQG